MRNITLNARSIHRELHKPYPIAGFAPLPPSPTSIMYADPVAAQRHTAAVVAAFRARYPDWAEEDMEGLPYAR